MSRAVMQQALEALEKATRFMSDSDYKKLNQAINDLRAALAEPKQEPVAWMSQGGDVARSKRFLEKMGFSNLIPLYTAPTPQPEQESDTDCHAQGICQRSGYSISPAPHREPEQEPVAWMCPDDPDRATAFAWRYGYCIDCGKPRIPLYIGHTGDSK